MFWVLKRLSYRDGSFEYPPHMFWFPSQMQRHMIIYFNIGQVVSLKRYV